MNGEGWRLWFDTEIEEEKSAFDWTTPLKSPNKVHLPITCHNYKKDESIDSIESGD